MSKWILLFFQPATSELVGVTGSLSCLEEGDTDHWWDKPHERQLKSAAAGPTASLTEHFDLSVDGHIPVLHRAGVDALIIMGDVSDLKTAVGEQVDSGIC